MICVGKKKERIRRERESRKITNDFLLGGENKTVGLDITFADHRQLGRHCGPKPIGSVRARLDLLKFFCHRLPVRICKMFTHDYPASN